MARTDEALDAILRSLLEQGALGDRVLGDQGLSDGGPGGQGSFEIGGRPLPGLPASAATTVHRVKVTLRGTRPPVWRRLEIPSSLPLSMLHEVLQTAFGWFDCHQHQFETACGDFGDPAQAGFWARRADEGSAAVAQVAPASRDRIGYVYDFGDNWRHDLVVEAVLPAAPGVRYPRCTAVQGTPPDENCGGIAAFNSAPRASCSPAPSPADLSRQLEGMACVVVQASLPG